MPKPTLVGISEIASLLGVSKQRVDQLTHHPSFPAPLERIKAGPIYDKNDILAWQAKRQTRKG